MDYLKDIETILSKVKDDAVGKYIDDQVERQIRRTERDAEKTLVELIEENNLQKFSDLEFDFFDDQFGCVLIPYEDYAIMARSRWGTSSGALTLYAEYAIYHATHSWEENEKIMNDLRYDATYTLVSICPETFENIALAVCHATAALYMKKGE